jgi:hypothetical protein
LRGVVRALVARLLSRLQTAYSSPLEKPGRRNHCVVFVVEL